MATVIGLCLFIAVWATIDFAYRLGLSKHSSPTQETRDSIFLDLAAIGISVGCTVGAFVIRLTGIDNDFARIVVAVVGAAIGFFTIGLMGDKSIARWLGVDLKDRSE